MKTRRSYFCEVFFYTLIAFIFIGGGSLSLNNAQAAESFCFVITGDSRGDRTFPGGREEINTRVFEKVIHEAANTQCRLGGDPDFIVFDGDLINSRDVNNRHLDIESQKAEFENWKDVIAPQIAPIFPENKIMMTFGGNHDGNAVSDPVNNPQEVWAAWEDSFDPVTSFTFFGASCEYPKIGPSLPGGDGFGHTVYYCEVENAGFFILNNQQLNREMGETQQNILKNFEISGDQLTWLTQMLNANLDNQINFFIHQVPMFTLLEDSKKKGMSSKSDKLNSYLKAVVSSKRPMVLSADGHNYHRRRINASLNPVPNDPAIPRGFELMELKICPAGAPVRNRALLGGNYRKNVEFFRAPERFTNNELYTQGLEHYFGIVSVDNSKDTPTVSVDVYAVTFITTQHDNIYVEDVTKLSLVTKTLIDSFQAYPIPSRQIRLIEPKKNAWRYFIASAVPPPKKNGKEWNEIGYNDSDWQPACIGGEQSDIGQGARGGTALWRTGIGYGDDDDCTVIPPSSTDNYLTVYSRLKFTLVDTSIIKRMTLSMDFDDGFVAYINGAEVACSNVDGCLDPGPTFSSPNWGFDQPAEDGHNARGYRQGKPFIDINKRQAPIDYPVDLSALTLQTGTNILAIQGHNVLDTSTDFSLIPWLRVQSNVSFIDVPPGYWAEDTIYKIFIAGITTGCSKNPLKYCPERTVTRDQMAVFLSRGIHGSSYTPPPATGIFDDVPVGRWAAAWIEQFYKDGITTGCNKNPLEFCPDADVTRAQMAIFLLRSKHGKSYKPPKATGIFTDVPVTYWAADWIEKLYKEGITTGCKKNPLMYCPDGSVTRAQMAVFIVRTFGL